MVHPVHVVLMVKKDVLDHLVILVSLAKKVKLVHVVITVIQVKRDQPVSPDVLVLKAILVTVVRKGIPDVLAVLVPTKSLPNSIKISMQSLK